MKKATHVIGVDEAGEMVWETIARGCRYFDGGEISYNLNSSCNEEVSCK